MTSVTFFKRQSVFCGFEVSGHSGYADVGSDIVCAAVSAVTEYMLEYLQAYCAENAAVTVDEQSACVRVMSHRPDDEVARHINIMHSTLSELFKQYGEYVRIQVKEV